MARIHDRISASVTIDSCPVLDFRGRRSFSVQIIKHSGTGTPTISLEIFGDGRAEAAVVDQISHPAFDTALQTHATTGNMTSIGSLGPFADSVIVEFPAAGAGDVLPQFGKAVPTLVGTGVWSVLLHEGEAS